MLLRTVKVGRQSSKAYYKVNNVLANNLDFRNYLSRKFKTRIHINTGMKCDSINRLVRYDLTGKNWVYFKLKR